jgi:hypothetical protein
MVIVQFPTFRENSGPSVPESMPCAVRFWPKSTVLSKISVTTAGSDQHAVGAVVFTWTKPEAPACVNVTAWDVGCPPAPESDNVIDSGVARSGPGVGIGVGVGWAGAPIEHAQSTIEAPTSKNANSLRPLGVCASIVVDSGET